MEGRANPERQYYIRQRMRVASLESSFRWVYPSVQCPLPSVTCQGEGGGGVLGLLPLPFVVNKKGRTAG